MQITDHPGMGIVPTMINRWLETWVMKWLPTPDVRDSVRVTQVSLLQSYDLTLNTSNPDLPLCFQNTALAWPAPIFLFCALPLYVYFVGRKPTMNGCKDISKLNIAKTVSFQFQFFFQKHGITQSTEQAFDWQRERTQSYDLQRTQHDWSRMNNSNGSLQVLVVGMMITVAFNLVWIETVPDPLASPGQDYYVNLVMKFIALVSAKHSWKRSHDQGQNDRISATGEGKEKVLRTVSLQIIMTYLTPWSFMKGENSSGTLFIFWFLTLLLEIIPFRSLFVRMDTFVSACFQCGSCTDSECQFTWFLHACRGYQKEAFELHPFYFLRCVKISLSGRKCQQPILHNLHHLLRSAGSGSFLVLLFWFVCIETVRSFWFCVFRCRKRTFAGEWRVKEKNSQSGKSTYCFSKSMTIVFFSSGKRQWTKTSVFFFLLQFTQTSR